jgi:predicted DNA-binding protein
MSLDAQLKTAKDKVEEKVITLRIPQNKATLLEMISNHYDLTMSALLRELIDDGIKKLQDDMLILSEHVGVQDEKHGEPFTIRYFPDIVRIIAPELFHEPRFHRPYVSYKDCLGERANFDVKLAELSYKYGTTQSVSVLDSEGKEHKFGWDEQTAFLKGNKK